MLAPTQSSWHCRLKTHHEKALGATMRSGTHGLPPPARLRLLLLLAGGGIYPTGSRRRRNSAASLQKLLRRGTRWLDDGVMNHAGTMGAACLADRPHLDIQNMRKNPQTLWARHHHVPVPGWIVPVFRNPDGRGCVWVLHRSSLHLGHSTYYRHQRTRTAALLMESVGSHAERNGVSREGSAHRDHLDRGKASAHHGE